MSAAPRSPTPGRRLAVDRRGARPSRIDPRTWIGPLLLAIAVGAASGREEAPPRPGPEIASYIEKLKRLDPEAAVILGRLGDKARPYLVDLARDGRSSEPERRAALVALKYMGPDARDAAPVVIGILASRDAGRGLRVASAEALAKIGPETPGVVAALVGVLREGEDLVVRQAATGALFEFGRRAGGAVSRLIPLLDSRDEQLRRDAADILGQIGQPVPGAERALVRMMAGGNPAERRSAAVTMRFVGACSPPALDELMKAAVDGSNTELQVAAIDTMADMGPIATAAIPVLLDLLGKGERRVCRSAAVAIGRIGPDPERIGPLVDSLDSEDPEIRQAAADALFRIGPKAGTAAGRLTQLLRDPDARVRRSAADTLGEIEPEEARGAVEDLGRLYLDDKEAAVRRSAAVALAKIHIRPGPRVLRKLRTDLHDPSPEIRDIAIFALRRIAPEPDLIPEFTRLLDAPQWNTRQAAIDGLSDVARPDDRAIARLSALLADPHWEVRRSAVRALGAMGATEARGSLSKALADPHWEVRRTAAFALLAVGSSTELAPQLIQALNDPDWIVRRACSDTLARIDPPPERDLIDILKKPGEEVGANARAGAVEALRQLGGKGHFALPDLAQRILDDPVPELRKRSVEALRSICIQLTVDADVLPSEELERRRAHVVGARKILTDQASRDPRDTERAGVYLSSALSGLDNLRWHRGLLQVYKVASDHWWATIPALWLLACFVFWWVVYRYNPMLILATSEALKRYLPRGLKLKGVEVTDALVVGASLIGLFRYRPRVLDAWVRTHGPAVVAAFRGLDTVKKHKLHIPVPVELDDDSIAIPDGPALAGIFARGNWCLLIQGEEGTGKTSLACEIARSVSREDGARPPGIPRMLPVLIDSEFTGERQEDPARALGARSGAEGKRLVRKIAGLLKQMTGDDHLPSDELVERLLSRRRILVVVDHLSEMMESTRRQVQLDREFQVNALIVTSRSDLDIGVKTRFRTCRIGGKNLESFLRTYLGEHQDAKPTDDEIAEAYAEILARHPDEQGVRIKDARDGANQILARKARPLVRES